MSNDWKDRLGVVYSTNPDHQYNVEENPEENSLPPNQQDLRIALDKKQRKGKKVTLVIGYKGSENNLKELGKELKSKCGTGGSVKNGEILIQGDFRDKVIDFLKKEGYKVKRTGG